MGGPSQRGVQCSAVQYNGRAESERGHPLLVDQIRAIVAKQMLSVLKREKCNYR
jgi:hypothetical protein